MLFRRLIKFDYSDVFHTDGSHYMKYQGEIPYKSKLRVAIDEAAVFMFNGRVADIFENGIYSLSKEELPKLNILNSFPIQHKYIEGDLFFIKKEHHHRGFDIPLFYSEDGEKIDKMQVRGRYMYNIIDIEKYVNSYVDGRLRGVIERNIVVSIKGIKEPSRNLVLNREMFDLQIWKDVQTAMNDIGIKIIDFCVEDIYYA